MATRRTRGEKVPRGTSTVISQTPSPSPRTLHSHRATPESQRMAAGAGGSRQHSLPSLSPAPNSTDVSRPPGAGEGALGLNAAAAAATVTAVAAPLAVSASTTAAATTTEAATEAETEAAAVAAAVVAAPEGEKFTGSRVGSGREKGGASAVAAPEGNEETGGSPRVDGGEKGDDAIVKPIIDVTRSPQAGGRLIGLLEASSTLTVTTTPVALAMAVTEVEAAAVAAAAAATVSEHCLPPSSARPAPPVSRDGNTDDSAANNPRRDPGKKRGRALARDETYADPQASAAGSVDGGVGVCDVVRSEDPALHEPDALAAHSASPSPARGETAPDVVYRRAPAAAARETGDEKMRATEAASDSRIATVDVLGGANEMAETPARPRQLATTVNVACGELNRAVEGVDDVTAGEVS